MIKVSQPVITTKSEKEQYCEETHLMFAILQQQGQSYNWLFLLFLLLSKLVRWVHLFQIEYKE